MCAVSEPSQQPNYTQSFNCAETVSHNEITMDDDLTNNNNNNNSHKNVNAGADDKSRYNRFMKDIKKVNEPATTTTTTTTTNTE